MRTLSSLFLVAALVLPSQAHAVKIFQVIKPVNPQNIVQVEVNMNNANARGPDFCKLKNISQLDFYYLMNGTTPQRSQIEGSIRARFKQGRPKPDNAALCPKNMPEGQTCSAIYVSMDEIGWVKHSLSDPTLVLKAVSSGGVCAVGAFIDSGSGPIVIDKVIAKGAKEGLGILPPSVTIRIDSVAIKPSGNGALLGPWNCTGSCYRKIYMDGREEIVR